MRAGKSLLPAGVREVEGSFSRGDTIAHRRRRRAARSPAGSSATTPTKRARSPARNRREIEAILGYAGRAAMVHRDDLVMTGARRREADGRQGCKPCLTTCGR